MGSKLTVVPKSGLAPREEVERVFQLQQRNKWRIAGTSAKQRIRKLKAVKRAVELRSDEIKAALHADFKKPEAEVMAAEIYPLTTEINHIVGNLRDWMRPEPVTPPLAFLGSTCQIRHQARGTSLIISPWNFPFQLAVGPLLSAVAAGCCAIVKPSEMSPHTSRFLRDFVGDLFDEAEVAVFEGDKEVAGALLDCPFDHIFFTGGTEVGKVVMAAASRHLSTVTLELGGKTPVIVDSSADLSHAAERIAWGKFINSGQTCVAPDYALVPIDLVDRFAKLVERSVVASYGPLERLDENPDYCRIINQRHFQRVVELMRDALQNGASLLAGGIVREDELFISPTLLADVPLDSRIMKDEIFGPLLPIIPYRDLDEAIAVVNGLPPALALYIFSGERKVMEKVLAQTQSGDALINDVVVHFSNVALPFGGLRQSGMGKSHGFHGFRSFSHRRSVMRQPRWTAISYLKPPYTPRVKRLIEFTIKFF